MADQYLKFRENNTYIVTFSLDDESGNNITLSSLGSLLLTLYYYNPDVTTSDRYHLATINNRYNQNVKNANNVAITSGGTCTWTVQPEDNSKLDQSTDMELHVALFTWTYATTKKNSNELYIYVQKIQYAI